MFNMEIMHGGGRVGYAESHDNEIVDVYWSHCPLCGQPDPEIATLGGDEVECEHCQGSFQVEVIHYLSA